MNEDRYSQDIDIEGKARELAGLPEEAINDIASMGKQMKDYFDTKNQFALKRWT